MADLPVCFIDSIQNLEDALELQKSRVGIYKHTYKKVGKILNILIDYHPKVDDDYQRIFLVSMILMKLARYCGELDHGGHKDSSMDLINYAAMLDAYTFGHPKDEKR